MFYFQQLLNQGLQGIDQTGLIPAIVGVAYAILLVGFLIGLYQAAMRGGDLQSLAVSAIKYLMVAVILANWSTSFHGVSDAFNQIAQSIDQSSGAGDMFLSWMDQLKQQFSDSGSTALLPAISGSMAAVITAVMIVFAYVIYAMAVVIFAFFYVLYGCVLYLLGPLVLAVLPIAGIGQLAKNYATNVMIWNAWSVLYAAFGSLITAIQFNRVDQVMSDGFLSGFFQGTADSLLLGLVSIFYALALLIIPFIAKRLISGDVGSSAYSLVRTSSTAAGALISGLSGFAAGMGTPEAGMALAHAGAAPSVASSAIAAVSSGSTPPPQPTLANTIRNGIRSAVNGNLSAPAMPGTDDTAAPRSSSIPIKGSSHFSHDWRPIGVTQTVAFHAARLTGAVVSGNARSAAAGGAA